jgi:cytochrome c oxidase subunit 4
MTEAAARHHPNYWAVWAGLAALTMVELGIAFLPWSKRLLILLLVGLAVWKALLVALYFMHLRYEANRMRVFAIAPLPLTVIIVVAVLTEYVW